MEVTANSVRTIRPRTLPAAYALAEMDMRCPNCGAEADDYCRAPDGYTRKIPCIARLHNNNDHVADDEPPVKPQPLQAVHDFSEPRHREEA